MNLQADLIDEVILLLDFSNAVVDGFRVQGPTSHDSEAEVVSYTYRRHVFPPGSCCVCALTIDEIEQRCSSSGGFHAFVGMADRDDVPPLHRAEARSVVLYRLTYDEFEFFVQHDNVFPISELVQTMVV